MKNIYVTYVIKRFEFHLQGIVLSISAHIQKYLNKEPYILWKQIKYRLIDSHHARRTNNCDGSIVLQEPASPVATNKWPHTGNKLQGAHNLPRKFKITKSSFAVSLFQVKVTFAFVLNRQKHHRYLLAASSCCIDRRNSIIRSLLWPGFIPDKPTQKTTKTVAQIL